MVKRNTILLSKSQINALSFSAFILFFIGFLTSRFLYSVGMLTACIVIVSNYKEAFKMNRFWWMKSLWAIVITVFLFDLFHSGLGGFNAATFTRMSLVIFPLFVFTWRPNDKTLSHANLTLLSFLSIASLYSLVNYGVNHAEILDNYGKAKVMKVLSYGDHIRMSWIIAASILLAIYEYIKAKGTYVKKWMAIYIIFQIIFIHLLGAKTGLIVLYAELLVLMFYGLIVKKNRMALLILVFIFLGPLLAYQYIPTFHIRLQYIQYDYSIYKDKQYVEGMSDGLRYFSIQGGLALFKDHFFLGTGFKKLKPSMAAWYHQNIPHMAENEYIYPSSEVLIFGVAAGILGFCLIIFHMISPIFDRYLRSSWMFMSIFPISTLTLFFETHFEGQMPVFVYGFLLAWFAYIAYSQNKNYIH